MTAHTDPTEPLDYLGRDAEMDYLLECHEDGSHVLKTRPLGGVRWSAPVALTPVAVGTLGRRA